MKFNKRKPIFGVSIFFSPFWLFRLKAKKESSDGCRSRGLIAVGAFFLIFFRSLLWICYKANLTQFRSSFFIRKRKKEKLISWWYLYKSQTSTRKGVQTFFLVKIQFWWNKRHLAFTIVLCRSRTRIINFFSDACVCRLRCRRRCWRKKRDPSFIFVVLFSFFNNSHPASQHYRR